MLKVEKMKIGILTQNFKSNYGGILQAYALQTVLRRMGHETMFLQRDREDMHKVSVASAIQWSKLLILRLCGQKFWTPKTEELNYIKQNTEVFVNKYLYRSPYLRSTGALRCFADSEGFEAYVVGSDQVWRPCYSPCLSNYFFDFAEKWDVKKVAYAASFGVDTWEFTKKLGKQCAALAKQFDAVSVREQSAVELCRKYLGISAVQVLDPTLLLCKEDYMQLVQDADEPKKEGTLFCYVLDESKEVKDVIESITQKTGKSPFYTMPKLKFNKGNAKAHIEDCVFPRVTEWLRSFIDAEMVVTDSFHGCVFSIIFNKPFWVVGNKSRGMARFDSLLSTFELQNRMISADSVSSIDLKSPIDWKLVEEQKKKLIDCSMNFLIQNLKNNE